jgi:hypothetical protein
MTTLRVELQVRDYDLWRSAFGKDEAGRERHGARGYRIFRAADDEHQVTLDVDFVTPEQAQAFLTVMQTEVWPSKDKAPAKVGAPKVRLIELIETLQY